MSDTTTRTVHMRLDPALAAYLAWLDQEGLEFDANTYGVFVAGYRAPHPAEPMAAEDAESTEFGVDYLW